MAVIQSDGTVAQSNEMVCYFDDGTSETHRSDEWNVDQMRLHAIAQGATFVSALSAPTGRILEYYVNNKPKVQSISMDKLFNFDIDNTGLAQPHNPWREDKSISMNELTETDSPYWWPQTKSNGPTP